MQIKSPTALTVWAAIVDAWAIDDGVAVIDVVMVSDENDVPVNDDGVRRNGTNDLKS